MGYNNTKKYNGDDFKEMAKKLEKLSGEKLFAPILPIQKKGTPMQIEIDDCFRCPFFIDKGEYQYFCRNLSPFKPYNEIHIWENLDYLKTAKSQNCQLEKNHILLIGI